jgi:hypothetical protein
LGCIYENFFPIALTSTTNKLANIFFFIYLKIHSHKNVCENVVLNGSLGQTGHSLIFEISPRKVKIFYFEVLIRMYKMGIPDFSDIRVSADRLQIFIICLPRINVSHANCIHIAEPCTRSARTLASQFKGHSTLLHLAYRFASEKLTSPANNVDPV